ncbi:hypothetical protein [Kerstersia sp.]|uniref:hypothetical protein n=1 Tax=Kerstersia sp. TaxID=1930783 RepID=UPI003F917E4B
MQTTQSSSVNTLAVARHGGESAHSAVSWGAVIAGAVIAAALSAALMTGGSGLGFLAVSPWQDEGASASVIAVSTIVWLFVTQVIAYGIAGYVAGRLRTKWTDADRDEIYFRDTAHGFLVWALSAVIGAIVLGSALMSAGSGAAKAGASLLEGGATVVGSVAGQGGGKQVLDDFTDTLLRPADSSLRTGTGEERREIGRIFVRGITQGKLDQEDKEYLTQRVAQYTGVEAPVAEQRIQQVSARAQQALDEAEQTARKAADAARKAAATFALWLFAALLLGAFVASLAATVGGRARDR